MSDGAPRRVRVTADARRLPASRSQPVRSAVAASADGTDDADAVYSRALRRTQLRLALGTVAGFVVVAVALTIAIAGIPELDRHDLGGVPLSWLLHAFAFYPVIFVFAVLYARGAARNEQRYRMLRDRG
ncbi:heavy metal transporter [Microbacterium sp. T2.11-28]|uniref:heavy metal transporter n=1 Tax=unclassified Microbacterium TaxID=2609290 RepID=UPI002477AF9F|nr:heavy metal transporter [Microbacterium sp. T2.11-28]CAI9389928.1 hypothetical protein MICABA_01277 [Microbacterium sp. T2.11-28]